MSTESSASDGSLTRGRCTMYAQVKRVSRSKVAGFAFGAAVSGSKMMSSLIANQRSVSGPLFVEAAMNDDCTRGRDFSPPTKLCDVPANEFSQPAGSMKIG